MACHSKIQNKSSPFSNIKLFYAIIIICFKFKINFKNKFKSEKIGSFLNKTAKKTSLSRCFLAAFLLPHPFTFTILREIEETFDFKHYERKTRNTRCSYLNILKVNAYTFLSSSHKSIRLLSHQEKSNKAVRYKTNRNWIASVHIREMIAIMICGRRTLRERKRERDNRIIFMLRKACGSRKEGIRELASTFPEKHAVNKPCD